MTKYYDEMVKKEREETPIAIDMNQYTDKNDFSNKEFICSVCNRVLSLANDQTKEFVCTHCTISYYPQFQEEVRSKSKLSMPGPDTDARGHIIPESDEVYVSYLPDPNEDYYKKKEIEPKGSFAALKAKGIKITDYEERSPT